MRYTSKCGLFAIDQVNDISATVRLSKKGLSSYGMFYVYIPRVEVGQGVKENQIVINIETSCVLSPIRSPLPGIVTYINNDLVDAPFNIDTNTTLFTLTTIPPDAFNSLVRV